MSQRKFLVQGSIRGRAFGPFPIPVTTIATLEPGEAFDESTVLALQHMLLEQNPGAEMARVLGFSPLEEKVPVTEVRLNPLTFDLLNDAEREHIYRMFKINGIEDGLTDVSNVIFPGERADLVREANAGPPELKLNPGSLLPPVDCPLLIELEPGVLIRASRPTFAESKGDQLVYETEHGLTITGRPRWTYP